MTRTYGTVKEPAHEVGGGHLVATHTRDVSMIEGEVEVLEIAALPQPRGDRFAARTGFDPACAGHAVPLAAHLPAPQLEAR